MTDEEKKKTEEESTEDTEHNLIRNRMRAELAAGAGERSRFILF